ncbi:MAG: hypothetical protein ACXVEC_15425 [Nocardioides sp.]
MTTVQATVREWDAARGGTTFRDDGTVLVLPPESLQRSVFRFLRAGQRVRVTLAEGVVVAVDLP